MNKFTKSIMSVGAGVATLALPVVALAADESAGPATFAGSYTLWIAIIIGFVVAILTLLFSVQMSGSAVGSVLRNFGLGILFIVLGFLSVVLAWTTPDVQKIVHDLLFIVGCLSCLAAVLKIRKTSM